MGPKRWVENLCINTNHCDDGAVYVVDMPDLDRRIKLIIQSFEHDSDHDMSWIGRVIGGWRRSKTRWITAIFGCSSNDRSAWGSGGHFDSVNSAV